MYLSRFSGTHLAGLLGVIRQLGLGHLQEAPGQIAAEGEKQGQVS